jgi:protein-tyrosine phosphatase
MMGRIDVHAHLIPEVDDGCRSIHESMQCARMLVEAGYTHCFCTPHIWPDLPENNITNIPRWVERVQVALDESAIPLKLYPGGEISLGPGVIDTAPEKIVTYAMQGRYVLFDLWAEKLPRHFEPAVRWLQSLGLRAIMAHPERMAAVNGDPAIAEYFAELGLLLQGNLQCLSEPVGSPIRRTIERYLVEDRYFMLGSDLHRPETLPMRLAGLTRAAELVGLATLKRLTITNPRQLMAPQS